MRKLIVQQFVSLDGMVADGEGNMSFVRGKPFNESNDEKFKAEALAFVNTIDTMILGANTYQMFASYWPVATIEGEFADKINGLTKYVASTKLTAAPWGELTPATITADPVTTIRELKQQTGKDIVLWGSPTLMQDMFDAGLVDEVQLRICPSTCGEGVRMFTDRQELELLETKPYESSMVVSKYRVLNR